MIELRAPFLTATLVSIVLGTAVAWTRNGVFNFLHFVLALVGGTFLHLGANISNDYYDHRSGNDEVNKEFVRPFSGGSRTIQQGLLTPKEVLSGSLLFYALAVSIGIYIAWAVGPIILGFGLIGMLSGFFYTGRPFTWVNRGIGEALVGLNFGALMTLGAYYVQTKQLSIEPLLASIPVSLLIAGVLYINEFPDYMADKAVGKNTLVVRLGRQGAAYGYALIMLGTYASILLNAVAGITPVYTLFALISIPLAFEATRHTLRFHSESFKLVPANALTIVVHLLTGFLISLGYVASRFNMYTLGYYTSAASFAGLSVLTGFFYIRIKKARRQKAQPA